MRAKTTGSRVRARRAACRARGSAARRPRVSDAGRRPSPRGGGAALLVGDADPHGGLPGARFVEGVAQRPGFEVPDAPIARSVHRLLIPVGRAASASDAGMASSTRRRLSGWEQSARRRPFTDLEAARPPIVGRRTPGSRLRRSSRRHAAGPCLRTQRERRQTIATHTQGTRPGVRSANAEARREAEVERRSSRGKCRHRDSSSDRRGFTRTTSDQHWNRRLAPKERPKGHAAQLDQTR